MLLPQWINWKTAIRKIESDNVDILVNLYRQFQAGKTRFMIAFRHPQTEDPLCLSYFFSQIVPKVAQHQGIKFKFPIHAHFIYDRGIPLWAGSHIGWLASQLGGTPIQRGKADWAGLRSARDLFVNGNFPMAAAPEGSTNGLSQIVSPLEPGIAQLSFWCAEDLHKTGRDEQVFILPVGIEYSYLSPPWEAIANLLEQLETTAGLSQHKNKFDDMVLGSEFPPACHSLYPRLLNLSEHLLGLIEDFYTRFYHQTLVKPEIIISESQDINQAIAIRLNTLLNAVLHIAEQYFNLPGKGNFNDRCRRVEQAGWNYIFRDDFKDITALSPLARALGDRVAEEANLHMWHMRLVESFMAVTGSYIREKPTAERFADTTLLIWDMVTRIAGGNPFKRPQLGKQRAKINIGKPLSVTERYSVYSDSRRAAKQAVVDLTNDLQQVMEGLIG
ncbi:FIG00872634: hypothetical protein [Richelia intracellularis]|nr:FIG00872634: hypothetical protein [Richelia intracellularis]